MGCYRLAAGSITFQERTADNNSHQVLIATASKSVLC
jgi:hypothetical protein